MLIHNILSPTEINDIVNHPVVQTYKAQLSHTVESNKVVKFSLPLAHDIRDKLSTRLGISLSHTIPMRWIKGDTLPHTDRGESQFTKTHLVYLTSSSGSLVIDGQAYPIHAGDAHVFSEGLEHFTINTGTTERLLLGPMSETGFGVGELSSSILYFQNRSDAENNMNSVGRYTYTVETINDISAWVIYKNENEGGTTPSPNGGPYNSGTDLINNGVYFLYPYIQSPLLFCGSMFSNNAQVYYKSHTLSTGSGGSGVRNSRYKKRRT
jgi:hypothetical protein